MSTAGINSGALNADSPLVTFFNNVNSGSQINSAGYVLNAAAGSQTYSYTAADGAYRLECRFVSLPSPSHPPLCSVPSAHLRFFAAAGTD